MTLFLSYFRRSFAEYFGLNETVSVFLAYYLNCDKCKQWSIFLSKHYRKWCSCLCDSAMTRKWKPIHVCVSTLLHTRYACTEISNLSNEHNSAYGIFGRAMSKLYKSYGKFTNKFMEGRNLENPHVYHCILIKGMTVGPCMYTIIKLTSPLVYISQV